MLTSVHLRGPPLPLILTGGKKNDLHSNFCEIVSLTVDILLPRPVLSDSCFFVTLVSILFPVERHYDQPILSISCIIQCTVQRVTGRIKSAQTTAWNKCCTVPKPLWSGSSVCPLLFSASFIVLYLFIYLFFAVCVQKPRRIFLKKIENGCNPFFKDLPVFLFCYKKEEFSYLLVTHKCSINIYLDLIYELDRS